MHSAILSAAVDKTRSQDYTMCASSARRTHIEYERSRPDRWQNADLGSDGSAGIYDM